MEAVTPVLIVKIVPTVAELFPETVNMFAPGPAMVMLAAIAGSGLSRVMVGVTVLANWITSPAAACVIASRSEQVPVPQLPAASDESAVVFTVSVAAPAFPKRPRLHNTRQ